MSKQKNKSNRKKNRKDDKKPGFPGATKASKEMYRRGNGKSISTLSKLQEKMQKRLNGGKFRMLNEQLYTTTGKEAFETFQENPDLFDVVRKYASKNSPM